MAKVMTPSVVRQIGSLFDGGSVAGLSDRQLLERFVARRDPAGEAAFAALVTRHGPMVLGVCRQLLGDRHHAEDAFQAVFLVLARKAGSIRDPDLLGNWLYGVALRTSRKARVRLGPPSQGRGGPLDEASRSRTRPSPADQPAIDREQAEALHDEIDRLPGAFRLPVVLCYFEGLTLDEAARRLRCPAGTLRSRLARARDKLRRGLTRRGVVLPAAALAAVLDARSASASVSSPLCDITTRAAIELRGRTGRLALGGGPCPGGAPNHVDPQAEIHRPDLAVPRRRRHRRGISDPRPGDEAMSPESPRPVRHRRSPRSRMTPTRSRPRAGCSWSAACSTRRENRCRARRSWSMRGAWRPGGHPTVVRSGARSRSATPARTARAGSGIDAPRTSSSRHEEFGAVALAPGYGVGWVELDPDDDQPTADITLRPEQVIHGRLFDVQGRPVPDVTVSVASIRRVLPQAPARAS